MDYIEQEASLNQIALSSQVLCLCSGLSLIGVIPSFYNLGDYEEEVRSTGSWGTLCSLARWGHLALNQI